MESVVIVDMPSRVNRYGGEARIASILFHKLRSSFNTHYLGFETAYLKSNEKNLIIPSARVFGRDIRNKRISELPLSRLAYNLLIVRRLHGLDKAEIVRRLKEIRPIAIISNSVQDMPLLMYMRKKGIDSKFIYIDHGSISSEQIKGYFSDEAIPLTLGSGITARTVDEAKKKFFEFFDANVALNKSQYRSIRKFTNRVEYIPNGLDVEKKRNSARESSIRARYGINAYDTVVLYVGRMFERQKNVSTLIKAFMQIKRDAKLLLVGEGPSFNDYVSLAKGDDRIIFTGSVDEGRLQYFYNIADVFVTPSFWEGFSLTMLEAAAHHVPVLLSEGACIEDIKGYGILTFETGNAGSLRRSLERLISSKRAMRLASAASARISSDFTEEKMLNRYKALIEKLAGKREKSE